LTGNRSGVRDQKRELIEALRAIEGAIMDAAKKVGNTRDMVMQQTLSGAGASML
jgi:nucleoporin p58/p45